MTRPLSPSSAPSIHASRRRAPDAASKMTVFVLVVATLYFGREVLVPVTLALLLTFLLAPLVTWFRKTFLGRVPSVVLVVTLALGVLVAIGSVIGGQLRELAGDLPNYASTIEAKVAAIKLETTGRLSHVMDIAGGPQKAAPPASKVSPMLASHQGKAQPAPTAQSDAVSSVLPKPESLPTPWQLVELYITPLMSPLATIGIVFIIAVFALLQREDLRDRLIRLIGPEDIHRTTLAMDDAGRRLTQYFLSQLAINTLFGIVIGTGLYFIGVPKPILWGVLSAILRFIPYIGSLISAILPIALSAAIEPGWSMVLWTTAFFVVAEGVTGQVLEPLIYGQSSGLSPFSVIVAAIFWSWLWGPVGLFLSTPLTLCLAVMGRHVKGLEFLDIILGDRPPLTPTESFYQRILADDADEVLSQAELILKDMPLARYYDEVALPGMQLAAKDVELGMLTEDQQENIKGTIYELVKGLSEYEGKKDGVSGQGGSEKPDLDEIITVENDAGPHGDISAAGQTPGAVLSIAGRGPLDEPAATMLVQLLSQRGIGNRLVRYNDVSRYRVETLDTANVMMVCVAYLDISGGLAHLRYLVQRLRKHLPAGTPILVGLWPKDDQATNSTQTRTEIGADYFSSSFEDVLKCCHSIADNSAASGTVTSNTPYDSHSPALGL